MPVDESYRKQVSLLVKIVPLIAKEPVFALKGGTAINLPHYTIHLGDVYYVGVKDEVEENCLGQPDANHSFTPCLWPWGSVGSFALNGNHEMYALGEAYFEVFLPTLGLRPAPGVKPGGQKASFFCLENKFWRVIGLDTGYNSIGVPILEYILSPSCKLRNEESSPGCKAQ